MKNKTFVYTTNPLIKHNKNTEKINKISNPMSQIKKTNSFCAKCEHIISHTHSFLRAY